MKTAAGAKFLSLARNIQAIRKCSWDEAWNSCKVENPELFNEMCQGGGSSSSGFSNEAQRKRAVNAKHEAQVAFTAKVHTYMREFKVDYSTAWNRCQTRHADLFNEMKAPLPSNQYFDAHKCALFRLSSTNQDEANAAFVANGSKLSPVDYKAVYEGLINYFTTTKNFTRDQAVSHVGAVHPNLASIQDAFKS
jgi:hypothetical protein